ncbi:ubiquitin-protein ligase [Cyathus striatus]|nr:ubiquitin-protein ligase [Cyathus striatus]
MVLLVSSDNEQFSTDKDIICRSVLIRNILEDIGESDHAIPLPNVTGRVFKKVLEFCEYHRKDPFPLDENQQQDNLSKRKDCLPQWDKEFCDVDQEMLFEVIMAANYLDIEQLLDAGCITVASMIKGKSPEDLRRIFNIVNDYTPEEEAQIKKENEWAEDN